MCSCVRVRGRAGTGTGLYAWACVCPLLSLCAGSVVRVWTALVGSCEVAAMFYWWLLFQKPDQIEVGEDGFKQWDGKTSQKTASDPCLPSSVRNSHPLIPHTHSHFKSTSVLASLIISSSILERNGDISLSILFIITTYLFETADCFCCFLFVPPHSDHSFGHGGNDQHDKRLDWEPGEVRPFAWCQPHTYRWRERTWGADAHPDRGRLPAL